MKKRWIANINELMARLANPYRPERHYMRGGKARELATRIDPRRDARLNRDHRSHHSAPDGK